MPNKIIFLNFFNKTNDENIQRMNEFRYVWICKVNQWYDNVMTALFTISNVGWGWECEIEFVIVWCEWV